MGMDISMVAALGIGRGLKILQLTYPAAYTHVKMVIGTAAAALTEITEALRDDKITAEEIDQAVAKVQGSGAGRLVTGFLSGAISAALTRFR